MPKAKYDKVRLPISVENSLKDVGMRLSSFRTSDFVHRGLFNPSVHLLRRQGKMVRPTLVLLGAYFLKDDPKKYVDLAVAAELVHISSIIHDDIIDRDDERRGVATVHKEYGNEAALLAGDALIAKAIRMASVYGGRVMDEMAKASMKMCAGELLDYDFQRSRKEPGVEGCLNVAQLKSASLIAACCSVAAIHNRDSHAKEMSAFGTDLGIAFQIRDDIMDYILWEKERKGSRPIPNIVSSIEKERGVEGRDAIAEAKELNRRYINSASKKLGKASGSKLLRDYAELILFRV